MLSSLYNRSLPPHDLGDAAGSFTTADPPARFSFSNRARPLSTVSGVSLASTTSTSSYTVALERRRRSAALLELAADDATRLSLQRAEDILRASEDARTRDQRRSASLRSRDSFVHDLTRSTGQVTFEIPSSVSSVEELRGGDENRDQNNVELSETLRRFSPKRFLLGRPRPPRGAMSTKFNTISSPMALAPSPPRSITSDRHRRRGSETMKVPQPVPATRSVAPRPTTTLPSHSSRLYLPPNDPFSKFSGSSSDSLVGVKGPSKEEPTVKLEEKPGRATKRGFKALRQKLAGTRRGSIDAQKKGVRKRASFASLFGLTGAVANETSSADDLKTSPYLASTSTSSQQTVSNSGASSHRPSLSISSFATSSASATGSAAQSRSSSRLGFFRTLGKRSSFTSGRSSRQSRVSGQISTSSISAPLPLTSPKESHTAPRPTVRAVCQGDTEPAQVTLEPAPSPLRKKGWLSTLSRSARGQNVATKRALFEPGDSMATGSDRLVSLERRKLHERPVSRQPPAARPAPAAPLVRSRAAAFDALAIQSSVPRVRPKFRPSAQLRSQAPSPRDGLEHAPSGVTLGERAGQSNSIRSEGRASGHDGYGTPAPTSSSSGRSLAPTLNSTSHGSPSLRHSRDRLTSQTAGGPIKDSRGLPIRQRQPTGSPSPRKLALGPDHGDDLTGAQRPLGVPIRRVRGATTDLAELLGDLDETCDVNTSVLDLCQLNLQSGNVASNNLYDLMVAVDERLSIQLDDMVARGFGDEDGLSTSSDSSSSSEDSFEEIREPFVLQVSTSDHLAAPFIYTTYRSEEEVATSGYDITKSSFEGHCSTAAAALRSMLSGRDETGPLPPVSATLRTFPAPMSATLRPDQRWADTTIPASPDVSRQERDRPAAGEKMFDRAPEVPLSALVYSSPSDDGKPFAGQPRLSLESLTTSPSPSPAIGRRVRQSLARYSQYGSSVGPEHAARPDSMSSLQSSLHSITGETTSQSLAASTRSTNLSVASSRSSPCPAARRCRIPMLTGKPIPLRPSFKFPLPAIRDEDLQHEQVSAAVQDGRPLSSGQHLHHLPNALLAPPMPATALISPQRVPSGPFELAAGPSASASSDRLIELEPATQSYEWTARTNVDSNRHYFALVYEVETELKRSLTLWPNTDYSLEMLANFVIPRTYSAILDFLFASQNRFPSPVSLARLPSFVAPAFEDPLPLVDEYSDGSPPASPPRSISPSRNGEALPSVVRPDVESAEAPLDYVVAQLQVPAARRILAEKAVNRVHAGVLTTENALSPFTALPPRLKVFRRGPVCDTGFLGANVPHKRQDQLDAAMRRLEGIGAPEEQRSGGETDDTGVYEAHGEAKEELSFTQSPLSSSIKPRRSHRRTALLMR